MDDRPTAQESRVYILGGTKDIERLIRHLKEHIVSRVPEPLFDRYQWLYGDV